MGRKGRKIKYYKPRMELALQKPPKYGECPECSMAQAVGTIKDHSGQTELQCKYCLGTYKSFNQHDLYTPYEATVDWREREHYRKRAALHGVTLRPDFKPPEPVIIRPIKPEEDEPDEVDVVDMEAREDGLGDDKVRDVKPKKKRTKIQIGLPPCTIGMKFLSLGESMELAQKARYARGERSRLPNDGVVRVGKLTNAKKLELEDYQRIANGDPVRTRILYNVNNPKKTLKRNGKENGHTGPRIEGVYSRPKISPGKRLSEEPARRKEKHLRI